jgi:N6-adenosine-specific RNA methylase IME4/ParB-like chromosome segregation protein Spo0J
MKDATDRTAADSSPTEETQRLRPHPEASLIPSLTAAEYRALVADVEGRGIVTPLAITRARVVVDGHQRLRAAYELGLDRLPVRVVAPGDEVVYMLLAAIRRRHLTASQKAALALELASYEELRAQARVRQRQNLAQHAEVATLPPRGKTREHLAEIAGVSARTAQDVISVYEGDPALFEQVKAGTLAAPLAARRVRRAKRDAALPAAPPLPAGPFEIVYADPPWQLGNPDGPFAPENHYPTQALEEITALTVPAAKDALLFLWAVNCLLPQAIEVMAAWGFAYVTNLAWIKPSIGPGRWVRNRHELLLLGRKGSFQAPELEDLPDSVIEAPRRRHSQKPSCVYERIERMYPRASKVELFARGTPRAGWVFWGNEVEEP